MHGLYKWVFSPNRSLWASHYFIICCVTLATYYHEFHTLTIMVFLIKYTEHMINTTIDCISQGWTSSLHALRASRNGEGMGGIQMNVGREWDGAEIIGREWWVGSGVRDGDKEGNFGQTCSQKACFFCFFITVYSYIDKYSIFICYLLNYWSIIKLSILL